jgi:methylthioribose-1-phosphate isomerase
MPQPLLTRHGDIVQYDRELGTALVLNQHRYPAETVFTACADLDALLDTVASLAAPDPLLLSDIAHYALALVAHRHKDWPTESQRAALIQTFTQLRQTPLFAAAALDSLDRALGQADAALIRGEPVAALLADIGDAYAARCDAAAESCGRHAAGLLKAGDRVLTHGFGGVAFNWMLHVAHVEQQMGLHLFVTENRPGLWGSRLATHQSRAIGVPVTLLPDTAAGLCMRQGKITTFVTGAERVALDGSVVHTVGTSQYAALADRYGVPYYALACSGPDHRLPNGDAAPLREADPARSREWAETQQAPEDAVVYYPIVDLSAPELVTAIVTDQGVWRTEDLVDYRASL